ncbi:uncharacterized protein DUF2599 [Nocardia tenerifensis]|uniref:Uncharacterized protein DUF2599 n=1 Tax=Nocardia tenerifensis TaxID=228006 RepID=A0A318K9Z3_9NOCA|nr:DUF2599 domain-containing protein [Nocardia tenerifensis]PXX70707.1 uncharacterized protein DUF2599 [Nocardia tenerifensis]
MRHPNRPTRVPRRPDRALQARTTVLLCAAMLPTACASNDPTPVSPITTTLSTTPQPRTSTATPSTTPATDPFAGMPLIDHADWTTAVDGPRLRVYPTPAGRQDTFPGADERAWQEVIAQAPDADAPGMHDQFRCHWIWARLVEPDKPSWNLEPWRPAVGYPATVEARCNPGGPER